jgi:hypothetical protein
MLERSDVSKHLPGKGRRSSGKGKHDGIDKDKTVKLWDAFFFTT